MRETVHPAFCRAPVALARACALKRIVAHVLRSLFSKRCIVDIVFVDQDA